jgi:hypothetical protein
MIAAFLSKHYQDSKDIDKLAYCTQILKLNNS